MKAMPIAIAIVLVSFGVTFLFAAIVGGGIEFSRLKISPIVGAGKRILTGFLGTLLLISPFLYNDISKEITPLNPVVTPLPLPPSDAATLEGEVVLSHHMADFRNLYTDFWIMASAGPAQEIMGHLDAQGQFRINDVPEDLQHTVLWGVSEPRNFVIWPLNHPAVSPGADLRGFRFQRLGDVFINQKRRMLEAVTTGTFVDANARLLDILRLFDRLREASNEPSDSITNRIRRWRFTLPRDLAEAAHRFRLHNGVSDTQMQIERRWRRMMITEALEQAAPGQQFRDLVRAMNSWSAYAREVFRRSQRNWPDRSLGSRQGGEEFLERASYAEFMIEDIALIQEQLAVPEVETQINEHISSYSQRAQLTEGQQEAVASFTLLLEQDPDVVSLSQLVNLLSALHKLVGATNMDTP